MTHLCFKFSIVITGPVDDETQTSRFVMSLLCLCQSFRAIANRHQTLPLLGMVREGCEVFGVNPVLLQRNLKRMIGIDELQAVGGEGRLVAWGDGEQFTRDITLSTARTARHEHALEYARIVHAFREYRIAFKECLTLVNFVEECKPIRHASYPCYTERPDVS